MKYLPLYYEWLKETQIPDIGLCNCIPESDVSLFSPTGEGFNDMYYWGFDGTRLDITYDAELLDRRRFEFTPLRQNIVLFLAAMNNEL